MKRFVLIAPVLFCSVLSPGGQWTRWRGPDNTGHVPPGAAIPSTLPEKPKVLWRRRVGKSLASPVVSGKRLFHIDNRRNKETVCALDAVTGKELWQAVLDDAFKDGQSEPGPRCTPVVDGKYLYAQSCRGEFQCLRGVDGKVVWRANFVKDFGAIFIGEKGSAAGASRHGYSGSPLVDGERIIVGVGGVKGASVVCFNKLTGEVIWKSQDDVPGYAGPVIATICGVRQIVSFASSAVVGLHADTGALLWRTDVKTRLGRHVTTPVVVGDIVVVSSHQAGLIGIKVSPAGHDKALTAERAWVLRGSAMINFSSPVAVDGHLYGLGRSRTLLCVDVRTGKPAWTKDWPDSRTFGKGWAAMTVMGRNVTALTEDGTLLMFPADPKAFRLTAKTRVCRKNWCHPAYADGKLYLRDATELLCIELVDARAASPAPTTWQQAMAAALARAKADDTDYIADHMLAPAYVQTLIAKYGKDDWKAKFKKDKLTHLPYYYGWLENPRITTSGDTTTIRGAHGCYATFITIKGKVRLGDFGQSLSSM